MARNARIVTDAPGRPPYNPRAACAAPGKDMGDIRVLALYPGFHPEANEMAMVWQQACALGGLRVLALAPALDLFKGARSAQQRLDAGALSVRWLDDQQHPLRATEDVLAQARQFAPDIVFVATRGNLPAGRALAQALDATLVVHTEFFFTDAMLVNRREYLGVPALIPLAAARARRALRNGPAVVYVSDPPERARFGGERTLQYLPWPHPAPPAGSEAVAQDARDVDRFVYIGSLSRMKGARRLGTYLCHAAQTMPDLKMLLIGPPMDPEGRAVLTMLQQRLGARLDYRTHVPREEAMRLIARTFMVFSPGDFMGWGQIGDAWWRGTPVVACRPHYDLVHDSNCLVVASAADFAQTVSRLRADVTLRARLAQGGLETVARHAVPAVAHGLHASLTALMRPPG